MNIATALGLLIGFGSLAISVVSEGGELSAFINMPAALVVFGGTLGAALVSFPGATVKQLPRLIGKAFRYRPTTPLSVGRILVHLAERARREGLLALEEDAAEIEDPMLRRGVMLVVDGTDPELLKSVLESEMGIREKEQEAQYGLLEAMGGYAPTMGIIGTVMGLVHVLSSLTDPSRLGAAIAVAFIATFYGVSSANLLWLPFASKLKKQSETEGVIGQMILEGLVSIQSGENPRILQERLAPYLPAEQQGDALREQESDAVPGRVQESAAAG